jgi:hypothetical protein
LANTLGRDALFPADLFQSLWIALQSVSQPQETALTRIETLQRGTDSLASLLLESFVKRLIIDRVRHRTRLVILRLERVGQRSHVQGPLESDPSSEEHRVVDAETC